MTRKPRQGRHGATEHPVVRLLAGLLGGGIDHGLLKRVILRVGADGFLHRGRGGDKIFLSGKGFRISFWIFDSDGKLQRVMVRAAEALDHVQGVAVRMAGVIEPGLVVERDRVDDECVALVPSDRVAHPCRVRVLAMFGNHRDGPPNASKLIENVYHLWSLNYRKLPGIHVNARYAGRIAVPLNRIVDALESLLGPKGRPRFLPFGRCPGGHGSQLRFLAERVGGVPSVYPYAVGSGSPKTGKIRRVGRRLGRLSLCRSLLRSSLW